MAELAYAWKIHQLFAYTVAAFTVCLLVWFQIFEKADVIRVGNRTELIRTFFFLRRLDVYIFPS